VYKVSQLNKSPFFLWLGCFIFWLFGLVCHARDSQLVWGLCYHMGGNVSGQPDDGGGHLHPQFGGLRVRSACGWEIG